MVLRVDSEVGQLRRVLLHRPGAELRRLTPAHRAELLFDDVVSVDRAVAEHDAFADVLRAHGVEVLYLGDLLAETLDNDVARKWVIDHTVADSDLGSMSARRVRDHLATQDAAQLATTLVVGLLHGDLPGDGGLVWSSQGPTDALLTPLPNHLYTRDASCWIFDGVSLDRMAQPVRRRETVHLEAIYSFHPRFAGEHFHAWSGGIEDHEEQRGGASLEGGDVAVLAPGVVLIGMGERTTAAAIEQLAERLFAPGAAREIVVVELPRTRSYMHLDTVMTMVDRDAFLVYPEVVDAARCWSVTPGASTNELAVVARPSVLDAVAGALGLDALRVVTTGGDPFGAAREQWDDADNVLALSPGVVVAYDRNVDTNARLRDAGIEVIAVDGTELSRGRGGPRCLTCPIARDAA